MGRIRKLLRLGRKNKNWRTASGHRTKHTANERRHYLATRPRRKDQEFRVKRSDDPIYRWDVQWRNK